MWRIMHFFVIIAGIWSFPAVAADCGAATSPGTAPPEWQTYCWLDFSTYSDTAALSASGQNFSFVLSDGATLSFNLKAASTAASAATAIVAPSWTGAAVGNSAFLGIPGKPILYMVNSGSTVTFTISSITVAPPPGAPSVTVFAFVAADAESTDNAETLSFGTNGAGWTVLDQVNPISGSQYPSITGVGTSTFTESGAGQTGRVGGYIVGTVLDAANPSQVTASMKGQGLQGMMFAVRFASLRLNKAIAGVRINAADQFRFDIKATSGGAQLGTGVSTGSGNGPFNAAVVSFSSGLPLTLSETMEPGSVSSLSQYLATLNCTNGATGSTTPLPSNIATSSYNLGSLRFGDSVQCTFTNTAYPHISLRKALGAGGRRFNTDQFTLNIASGGAAVATTTTTETGATLSTAATPVTQLLAGTQYVFSEAASGSTSLSQYTTAVACSNANASSTTSLPATLPGSITPVLGDVVSCVITNTRKAANALLIITKTSDVVSDPVNGTNNPKAIPGAVLRYTISVTNTGTTSVTASSIVITDPMPAALVYDASAPIIFQDGTPASGLTTFSAATMVTYSNQANGGNPFSYTPNTATYDANVKGMRIAPSGTMAGATAGGTPSFTISFLAKIL